MNLLTGNWIPVRQTGGTEKISLKQLLCGEKQGEICLPRDDMEFACLQLLAAITQVLFTPENKKQLVQRIEQPLTEKEYLDGCKDKKDWFDLDHPETPFMQFRGVNAKAPTPMEKLMVGVSDGTNKAFVNQLGLVNGLCSGCVAIALYNTAYNSPSMGGGFKSGMRGSTPITVLIRDSGFRQTLWHNVLTRESLEGEMPWLKETPDSSPNYVQGLERNSEINAHQIGLAQGLFWQPAYFELREKDTDGACSCCGQKQLLYTGFKKEKFKYNIKEIWPHPLSARTFTIKNGEKEEKFPSFTSTQPGWVHLAKLVVDMNKDKEGNSAVPVVTQLKSFGKKRLDFIVGGYRNNQATVLERRHEMFSLADGWQNNTEVVDELVSRAQDYKKALRKTLYLFGKGITDHFDGVGVSLTEQYDRVFYQQTEELIHRALARIDFKQPQESLDKLCQSLKIKVKKLFDQAVAPYRQEPKMLKAVASSRRLLNKYLKELEPQVANHE